MKERVYGIHSMHTESGVANLDRNSLLGGEFAGHTCGGQGED